MQGPICLCLLLIGLQTSNKPSGYPVRMDNSVPLVPQNQSSQSLHIQPSMLTQVGVTARPPELSLSGLY